MLESTIESTFTSRDWHETTCAHCIEYGSCVSMADVPTCFHCLGKFYDEDGEPIELNVYQPETIKTGLHDFIINTLSDPPRVVCISAIVGIAIGNFIYDVAGGK